MQNKNTYKTAFKEQLDIFAERLKQYVSTDNGD